MSQDAERDRVATYKRDLDASRRFEPDLPSCGPEGPRTTGPSVADMERALGVGVPSVPAAQQARHRGRY